MEPGHAKPGHLTSSFEEKGKKHKKTLKKISMNSCCLQVARGGSGDLPLSARLTPV